MSIDGGHSFVWRPGNGPDAAALERMRDASLKPTYPMGEPWFMGGERTMYTELMTTKVNDLPLHALVDYLEVIGRGTSAFGPIDDGWAAWFHYLLPRTAGAASQADLGVPLAQVVISVFITQYPENITNHYPEFRHDVMDALGNWLMAAEFWDGNDLKPGTILLRTLGAKYGRDWWDSDSSISASLFFCWKYLLPEEIDAWLSSVFAIKGAHWTANLLVWLVGIQPILSGDINQPVQFNRLEPNINWETSYILKGSYDGEHRTPNIIPFLSAPNIKAFQAALRKYLTEELFFEWLDSFEAFDHLKNELYTLPDQFAAMYLTR